jgi:hypothetical protein
MKLANYTLDQLGLDFNTYSDRIQWIARKNLGPFTSEEETVTFTTNLHLRDLYLATACAKEVLGFGVRDITADSESPGWRALEKTYSGFIYDLAHFLSREHRMAQDVADVGRLRRGCCEWLSSAI